MKNIKAIVANNFIAAEFIVMILAPQNSPSTLIYENNVINQ